MLEDQAEASQKKLADKNSAIERLHSQLLLLTTNEAGRAAELAGVRWVVCAGWCALGGVRCVVCAA